MIKWWSRVWRPGNQTLEHSFNQTTGLCSANLLSFIEVTPCPPMSYLGFCRQENDNTYSHCFTTCSLSPLLHHRPPYQHYFHSLELAHFPLRSDACVTVYVKLFLFPPGKIHHCFPMLPESAFDFYCYQRTYFLVWQWALLVCPVGSLAPGQQGLYWFISACPMHSRTPAPEQEVNKWPNWCWISHKPPRLWLFGPVGWKGAGSWQRHVIMI